MKFKELPIFQILNSLSKFLRLTGTMSISWFIPTRLSRQSKSLGESSNSQQSLCGRNLSRNLGGTFGGREPFGPTGISCPLSERSQKRLLGSTSRIKDSPAIHPQDIRSSGFLAALIIKLEKEGNPRATKALQLFNLECERAGL